jgi:GrpB-like predicted nucleotidyltransferase (UPF0157 family)
VDDPVVIVDYDDAWPIEFDRLRARALGLLGDMNVSVEHIGSTAVPGCSAKPIVDLDVAVPSASHVPEAVRRLEVGGYVHQGDLGVEGREAFAPPAGEPRHHLYVVVAGNEAHLRHTRLRDHLRRHPDDVRAYGALKRELARRYRDDRARYTEAKSEFIARIVAGTRPSVR